MTKLTHALKTEVSELIPPTTYFVVGLGLVTLIRVLMLEGTGLDISTPLQIALVALVMGKAVVIADMIPFINRYPSKPLIYNVAWKTAIYMVVATVLHYLERLIHFWREAGSFTAGNQALLEKIVWPHFWAVEIVIALLVIFYCVFTELARLLGRENVDAIFFKRPPRQIVLPNVVES